MATYNTHTHILHMKVSQSTRIIQLPVPREFSNQMAATQSQ